VQPLSEALKLLGTSDRNLLAVMFPGRSEQDYTDFHAISNQVWRPLISRYPFVLYRGAAEMLRQLHEAGWIILLSSNCDHFYLHQMMTETPLREFVAAGVCAEMYPGKEKWEFTRSLLQNYQPFTGFFMGDSCSDMKAGRSSGLKTIYADYGYAVCSQTDLMDFRINVVSEAAGIILGDVIPG
jgi:phosphoglycolate phosphatase-like HAD superfamily hydrolase